MDNIKLKANMERKKEDKQIWLEAPEWLKDVKDDDVAGVFALMFGWQLEGGDKIDNLREYVKENFDDLSDEQVEEVAKLLIEHKVVEK